MSPQPAFALPSALPVKRCSQSPPLSRLSTRRASPPRASPMQPARATIAVPSGPAQARPESDEEGTASAPWMPLPGVVHEVGTPEEFDRLAEVAEEKQALLVADFMASWCRKCLYLLPKLRKIAKEFEQVYYCSVDVNKVRRLPKQFDIQKMPTFVFLKGGQRVDTLVGGAAPPKVAESVRAKIEKYGTS